MSESVKVVVVGDLMTDVVARTTDAIALHSDTRATIAMNGGGSGANTAAWLGSCGVPRRSSARAATTRPVGSVRPSSPRPA